MHTFTTIVLAVSGLYYLGAAAAMKTENLISSVVFKYIPLILGIGLMVVLADHLGLVMVS